MLRQIKRTKLKNTYLKIWTSGGQNHFVSMKFVVSNFDYDVCEHRVTPHHVHHLKPTKIVLHKLKIEIAT